PDDPDDPLPEIAATLRASGKDGDSAVVVVGDHGHLFTLIAGQLDVHDTTVDDPTGDVPRMRLYHKDYWQPGYTREMVEQGQAFAAFLTDRGGVIAARDLRDPDHESAPHPRGMIAGNPAEFGGEQAAPEPAAGASTPAPTPWNGGRSGSRSDEQSQAQPEILLRDVLARHGIDSLESLLNPVSGTDRATVARLREQVVAELVEAAGRHGVHDELQARYPSLFGMIGAAAARDAGEANPAAFAQRAAATDPPRSPNDGAAGPGENADVGDVDSEVAGVPPVERQSTEAVPTALPRRVELGHNLQQLRLEYQAAEAAPHSSRVEPDATRQLIDGISGLEAAMATANRYRSADKLKFTDLNRELGFPVSGPDAVRQLRDRLATVGGTDPRTAAGLRKLIELAENHARRQVRFDRLDLRVTALDALAAECRAARNELAQYTADRAERPDATAAALDTRIAEIRDLERRLLAGAAEASRIASGTGVELSEVPAGTTDGIRVVRNVAQRRAVTAIADAEGMAGYQRPHELEGLDDQCGRTALAANAARTGRDAGEIEPAVPGEGTLSSYIEARVERPGRPVKAHQVTTMRAAFDELHSWATAAELRAPGTGHGKSIFVLTAGTDGLGHMVELVSVVDNGRIRIDCWDAGHNSIQQDFLPAEASPGPKMIALWVDETGFSVDPPEELVPRPVERDEDIAVATSDTGDPEARARQLAQALARAGIDDIEQRVHREGEPAADARARGRR
ncbi:MAG: hypothetical protein HOQ44_00970, partial [Nocardia sp.]|nr:hypothetical protein [Nocardia sp.]